MRYLALFFCLSLPIFSANISAKNNEQLNDVSYSFDQNKLNASEDTFHFLRTFVDYFYLVAKENQNQLPLIKSLSGTQGWIVGDAHAENFGIVIKQTANDIIFTHNDMDDSGPAPLIYDIYRFMVSSTLYDDKIDLGEILKAYKKGLTGEDKKIPDAINDMIRKSQKNGIAPSKNKVLNNKFIRDSGMQELSVNDMQTMKNVVTAIKHLLSPNAFLVDAIATSKVGGGSGGLLRYELLINSNNSLIHLELKTAIRPSMYPVASQIIPQTSDRIEKMVTIDQGSNPSSLYQVLNINNQDMLMRPRFSGNVGVDLTKQNTKDNEEIIYYEAYTLGKIHARSLGNTTNWINSLQNLKGKDFQSDVNKMVNLFANKFAILTGNQTKIFN